MQTNKLSTLSTHNDVSKYTAMCAHTLLYRHKNPTCGGRSCEAATAASSLAPWRSDKWPRQSLLAVACFSSAGDCKGQARGKRASHVRVCKRVYDVHTHLRSPMHKHTHKHPGTCIHHYTSKINIKLSIIVRLYREMQKHKKHTRIPTSKQPTVCTFQNTGPERRIKGTCYDPDMRAPA